MWKKPPGRKSIFMAIMVKVAGVHHSFICSGSVKAAHTRSRGASSTRKMAKSTPPALVIFAPNGYSMSGLVCHKHHPPDTEFIGDHAEFGREKGLGERHGHLTALGESVEELVGFRLGVG